MKRAELSLRKELALAHLAVARAKVESACAEPSDRLAMVGSALDLTATVLAQPGFGRWSHWVRLGLSVAKGALSVTRAL